MYNKRELKKTERKQDKRDPFSRDMIYDPRGQWDNPGENTRILGGNVTMQGVPYQTYGVPYFNDGTKGQGVMMQPGQDYIFKDKDGELAKYVDEFPKMQQQPSHQMPDGTWMPGEEHEEYEDMELTDAEIAEYKRGGCVVQELPRAQNGLSPSQRASRNLSLREPTYEEVMQKLVDWTNQASDSVAQATSISDMKHRLKKLQDQYQKIQGAPALNKFVDNPFATSASNRDNWGYTGPLTGFAADPNDPNYSAPLPTFSMDKWMPSNFGFASLPTLSVDQTFPTPIDNRIPIPMSTPEDTGIKPPASVKQWQQNKAGTWHQVERPVNPEYLKSQQIGFYQDGASISYDDSLTLYKNSHRMKEILDWYNTEISMGITNNAGVNWATAWPTSSVGAGGKEFKRLQKENDSILQSFPGTIDPIERKIYPPQGNQNVWLYEKPEKSIPKPDMSMPTSLPTKPVEKLPTKKYNRNIIPMPKEDMTGKIKPPQSVTIQKFLPDGTPYTVQRPVKPQYLDSQKIGFYQDGGVPKAQDGFNQQAYDDSLSLYNWSKENEAKFHSLLNSDKLGASEEWNAFQDRREPITDGEWERLGALNNTYPKPVSSEYGTMRQLDGQEMNPSVRVYKKPVGAPKLTKTYEAAYENVDKKKYPTIDAFIADAEYYKIHGRNMSAEELADINNVTNYIGNNGAEENQIKSVELVDKDYYIEPVENSGVLYEDNDYTYHAPIGIDITNEAEMKKLMERQGADPDYLDIRLGAYRIPKTSVKEAPVGNPVPIIALPNPTPGTIKPPQSVKEWLKDPKTGTWYQKEKPAPVEELDEFNLNTGSYLQGGGESLPEYQTRGEVIYVDDENDPAYRDYLIRQALYQRSLEDAEIEKQYLKEGHQYDVDERNFLQGFNEHSDAQTNIDSCPGCAGDTPKIYNPYAYSNSSSNSVRGIMNIFNPDDLDQDAIAEKYGVTSKKFWVNDNERHFLYSAPKPETIVKVKPKGVIEIPTQQDVQRTLTTPVPSTTTEWREVYPGGPKQKIERPTPTTVNTPYVDESPANLELYNLNTGAPANLQNGGNLPKAQAGYGGGSDTDYFKYNPFSLHGKMTGVERFGQNNPTTDLTFGRSSIAPRFAKRQGFDSLGASLTTRLPYKNNTGVGVHGNLKFTSGYGELWPGARTNFETDISGGYDPKLGGYASLMAYAPATFGSIAPTINKVHKGEIKEGEWLAKVGPYAGVSGTPSREKEEERWSIPAGFKGEFDIGIGKGKTIGASGYYGTDIFGQASSGTYDASGLQGRSQYGFDVNLKIPFGRDQKRNIKNLFTRNDSKKEIESTYPSFAGSQPSINQDGGELLDLTDKEIQEYKDGGYIVEELPKAQDGILGAVKALPVKHKGVPYNNEENSTAYWLNKGNNQKAQQLSLQERMMQDAIARQGQIAQQVATSETTDPFKEKDHLQKNVQAAKLNKAIEEIEDPESSVDYLTDKQVLSELSSEERKEAERWVTDLKHYDTNMDAYRSLLKGRSHQDIATKYNLPGFRESGAWNNYGDGPLGHVGIMDKILGLKAATKLLGVAGEYASPYITSALNMPATIAGRTFPLLTGQNLMTSYFTADAIRRTPKAAKLWYEGNYEDALAETAHIGFDMGTPLGSKMFKQVGKHLKSAVDKGTHNIDKAWKTYRPVSKPEHINEYNIKKQLGQRLDAHTNTGIFNQGVYELKNLPKHLVKFENPQSVELMQGIKGYSEMDLAEAMANLPTDAPIGKVLKQIPGKKKARALVLNKVSGKPASALDLETMAGIPEQHIGDMYKNLIKLREENLAFDFIGDNYHYNPKTGFNLIDIAPFTKEHTGIGNMKFWQGEVFGGANPARFTAEEAAINLKKSIETKLLNDLQKAVGKNQLSKERASFLTEATKRKIQRSLAGLQDGGSIEMELTDEEIQQYRDGGYVIEEL